MAKFETLTEKVIPMQRNDVDTDQIIPAQYLTSVSRDGYGQNLFRRLKDSEPDFPFNQDRYKDAAVLVTGYNFGCGSSREHAVWALTGAGIKVVIAESFADIFTNNSAKNGLLLVVLPKDACDYLVQRAQKEDFQVTVNLENQTVTDGSKTFSFEYDPFRKHCLLNGLDDIEYILSFKDNIDAYREENETNWSVSTSKLKKETAAAGKGN